MKRILAVLLLAITPLLFLATTPTDSQAGFGAGVHYLVNIEDMDDTSGFDSSNLGFLGVYSFGPGLLNFELDLEYIPNYVDDEALFLPSAYAFVGSFIYGGLGVGIGHLDGEWADDPFFDLRAGVKIAVFDIFGSYRLQSLDEVGELSPDNLNSVTLGALFKF